MIRGFGIATDPANGKLKRTIPGAEAAFSMAAESDRLLVEQIRRGDTTAWQEMIDRYEGRIRAFVHKKIADPASTDDIVQETFLGFARSLPNYDDRLSLENWLFTIANNKVTDLLRKQGRRPWSTGNESDDERLAEAADRRQRAASSHARSKERRDLESRELASALRTVIQTWIRKRDYLRVQVLELLLVKGWANKDVARFLRLSEQDIANVRFAALSKLKKHMQTAGLSADVFPELSVRPEESGS